MMRLVGWALLLLGTGATAQPLPAEIEAAVQSQLGDQLYDGESARWRWWPPKEAADGTVQLCGFLNSKNRLGGYTGFNPVWVSGRWTGAAFVISGSEIARGPYLDGVAAKRCIAAGFSMTAVPPARP